MRDATLPTAPPADKQKVIDKLAKLESGAAFDREFVNTVGIHDHTADIALFEKASRDAKDAELKNFATTTLPTLREHLNAAKKLPARKG
jgi:putative membrane protein